MNRDLALLTEATIELLRAKRDRDRADLRILACQHKIATLEGVLGADNAAEVATLAEQLAAALGARVAKAAA